jgi:hypothetical protein
MYVLLMMWSIELLAFNNLVTNLTKCLIRQISHILSSNDPALHFTRVCHHGKKRSHVIQLVRNFINLHAGDPRRVVAVKSPVTPEETLTLVVQVERDQDTGAKTVAGGKLLENHLVCVVNLIPNLFSVLVNSHPCVLIRLLSLSNLVKD